MVDTPRVTLPWVCPICVEPIDVSMWWEPSPPPSALVVRKIDDLDARLHMEWHRLCTCQWDHVHTDEQVLPVQVTRHPTADCPVHP